MSPKSRHKRPKAAPVTSKPHAATYWYVALTVVAINLTLPAVLVATARERQVALWALNAPASFFFLLAVLPFAVATLGASWSSQPMVSTRERFGAAPLVIVALAFAGLTTLAVDYDFRTQEVAPYLLNSQAGHRDSAFALENIARNTSGANADSTALKSYAQLVQPFERWNEVRRRGNAAAYVLFALNLLGGLLVTGFICYCALAAIAGLKPRELEELMATFTLLTLWFPLRAYTLWYQSAFYKQNWLATAQIFFVLAVIAGLVLLVLFLIKAQRRVLKAIALINAVITAVVAAAEKFKWTSVLSVTDAVAVFLGQLPVQFALIVQVMFAIVIGLVTLSLLEGPPENVVAARSSNPSSPLSSP